MSYTASPSRIKSATVRESSSRQSGRGRSDARPAATRKRATGKSYDEARDWGKILLLGATVAAGAALGAGAALLFTEQTGPERRAHMARGARRLGHRAEHAWDDLAFELREAARSARNRFRRRRLAADAGADEDDDAD